MEAVTTLRLLRLTNKIEKTRHTHTQFASGLGTPPRSRSVGVGIVFQSPKNCAVTGLRVYKSTQTKFRDMSHTQIYIYIYIYTHT